MYALLTCASACVCVMCFSFLWIKRIQYKHVWPKVKNKYMLAFNNLNEMDKILENHILPKHTQEGK